MQYGCAAQTQIVLHENFFVCLFIYKAVNLFLMLKSWAF